MSWQVELVRGSIYLPQIDLWCDAHDPVACSFVSHAHFDHLAPHARVIASEGTQRLMQARMPGDRTEVVLPYGTCLPWQNASTLSLHPAGHIFGSAMLRAEREGSSLLYTGDFKLRPGRSAEPCQPVRAEVVIMETTFGLPRYVFPPTREVLEQIVHFCHSALEDGETPVLFGYSLGKSQEILAGLAGAGIPLMLHPQTQKMTRIYEELGRSFPAYRGFSLPEVSGHAVICPPLTRDSSWLRKISPRRTAVITGWAMDPGIIYRYQCDAAFPLSDHADYADLLKFVEQVQPKQVYTVHGFTEEFARTLRGRGIEAWALGRSNQLEMMLAGGPPTLVSTGGSQPSGDGAPTDSRVSPHDFLTWSRYAERIRATPLKTSKVESLQEYFRTLTQEDLGPAALFFTGRPFPACENRPLHCGWALIKGALLEVSGMSEADYRATYQKFSDTGETARAVLSGRTQPRAQSVGQILEFFSRLADCRGPQAKQQLLAAQLRGLSELEVKYLVKIITGDLRIGLKEGLVEEALSLAFSRPAESIREANMLSGDLGETARSAQRGELERLQLRTFHPIHFMLASPEPSAQAIVERLGEPVWLEEKYDGIRCQVHKEGDRVEFYSRELRRVTGQFPELARQVAKIPADFIADGELLAWQNGRALPFAELQKRLGRTGGDDLFLGAQIPLALWFYDLLGWKGASLLKCPLLHRRAMLDQLPVVPGVERAPYQMVRGAAAIEGAFIQARQRGNEGLMAKDPQSIYLPGRRGLSWLKLKKAYATLDVVVIGVEWGHGKRSQVLSDYTFAVRGDDGEQLLAVGKAYSGLTDLEIARFTEHFLRNTLVEKGRYRTVHPDVILEVGFDTIQPSSRHASGYALRFPRILRIRDDKTIAEIDTVSYCRELADKASTPPVSSST